MIKHLIYYPEEQLISSTKQLQEVIKYLLDNYSTVDEHDYLYYEVLSKQFESDCNHYFKTGETLFVLERITASLNSILEDAFVFTDLSLPLEDLSPDKWVKECSEMPYAISIDGFSSTTNKESFFTILDIISPNQVHNEGVLLVISQALNLYFSSGKITPELNVFIKSLNKITGEEKFKFETRKNLLTSSVETPVKETPQAAKPKSIFF